MYPFYEFVTLNKECRKLVEEADYDPIKQFKVAQSLIEGKNNFPLYIALGKQYLELSFSKKHPESIIYYVKMLIKGEIVPRSLTKASQNRDFKKLNSETQFFFVKKSIKNMDNNNLENIFK